MKYLTVELLKGSYTSQMNFTDKFTKFAIECEEGNYKKEDLKGYIILRLVKGNLPNTIKAVVIDTDNNVLSFKNHNSPMFGGYYLTSSDSRFSNICKNIIGLNIHFGYPVPVHDRFEPYNY